MIFWTLLGAAIAMTFAQVLVPGRPEYHAGWYNVLDAAFLLAALRGVRARSSGARLAAAGAALVVLAGVACGLMGPDTQSIAGAPGTSVQSKDFGTFVFPLEASAVPQVRYTVDSIVRAQPRSVVHVDAADPHGGHLTITQPSNASFLSPVLLMQQSTSIAGMQVQYDEFAVPALSRSVKALLFTAAQAAQLHNAQIPAGSSAVLFAVSDSKGRDMRGGLALVASGSEKPVGGMLLRAQVQSYPALSVTAIPYLPAALAGLAIFVVGAARESVPLENVNPSIFAAGTTTE